MNNSRESFSKPETRCGTCITEKQKLAWKCMLDILECFIGICTQHGLQYSVCTGSLLGAIRHGGIIPWDDDIDVCMPRCDYDKIQRVLPNELPRYYFMQTSKTDLEYPITHMKIRDSRTTGIDPYHAKRKMRFNMGIFMDVFPLDGCPDDTNQLMKIEMAALRLRRIRRNAYSHSCGSLVDWAKHIYGYGMYKLIGNDRIYDMREQLFRSIDLSSCNSCSLAPSEFGFRSRFSWPIECFAAYVDMPFEYLMVKVPVGYQKILDMSYGDWHKFVRGDHGHNDLVLDASKSYKETLRECFHYENY